MPEYVFIIVTADDCPHCLALKNDKKKFDDIYNIASMYPNIVQSIYIPLDRMNGKLPDAVIPRQIRYYMQYFPGFFLVELESWNKCIVNSNLHHYNLDIDIYGIKVIKNEIPGKKNEYEINLQPVGNNPLLPESIDNWVKLKISNNNNNNSNNSTNLVCEDNTSYIVCRRKKRF